MLIVALSNLRIPMKSFYKEMLDLMAFQFPSLKFSPAVSSSAVVVSPCINTVSTSDCNNKVPNSVYTWHLRLGHPNSQALKLVLNHCNQKFSVKDDLPFCSACCMGKIYRLPCQSSQTAYKSPLELI